MRYLSRFFQVTTILMAIMSCVTKAKPGFVWFGIGALGWMAIGCGIAYFVLETIDLVLTIKKSKE